MNEDMDRMTVAEPLAGDELERMLARYARVRLDPDPAQVRRARAAVMEDAWGHRLAANARRPPARRGLFSGWSSRRLGLSLTAAAFAGLMIGSSAFAASRAGGPLYETRLALEALGLPSEAAARVDSRIETAQARLADAVEAAGRHDPEAMSAALDAYDRVIDDLLSADGTAAARALEAVEFHHAVLLEIAGTVPDAATSGIERALANSERVIERLNESVSSAGAPGVNGDGLGPPGGKPMATGKPQPAHTRDPDATAKPRPTANPGGKREKTPSPRNAPAPSSAP